MLRTLAGHGFRAAPYSCRGAVDVKLIINLSPALEGLCDWQSFAEACRVEAGEQQNQQNHGDCQGAAAVPDGIWSKNQDLVRLSLPPACLVIWSGFTRSCAQAHV